MKENLSKLEALLSRFYSELLERGYAKSTYYAYRSAGARLVKWCDKNSILEYDEDVCKTNCVVLLPDNWQWDANTVGADWQADGYYWSSSAYTGNYAYGMYFHSSGAGLGSDDYRHICYSVRLITESK